MSIKIEDLKFTYFEDERDILSDLTVEFKSGEITVITGASGCGKSTLLYLAAGIYPHGGGILRSGTVTVEDTCPDRLAPRERCRLVSMMFQNPELQFCMDTVEHELQFCMENICIPQNEMEMRLEEALDFCEISHLRKRELHSLSGGEKQKVTLACMVLLDPKWLLLDEPFANIDDKSARGIAGKLKELNRTRGTGILAVDHRLENWLDIADKVRILEKGTLCSKEMNVDALEPDRLRELGVIVPGESYGLEIPPASPGDVVLELKAMSLCHGKRRIFSDVNAVFHGGCIYAITGESGCGKTSLFGALSGVYPYRGEVLLEGQKLRKIKKKDLGKLGFVTQDPQDQFVSDTVRNEILTGLKHQKNADDTAEKILREIRLWRYRDISPYMLSQGQQRRLGVAALMVYPCKALLCDEPTYAQDRNNTVAIMKNLCKAARNNGVALIFSTHDRRLAEECADEILELRGGHLCAL